MKKNSCFAVSFIGVILLFSNVCSFAESLDHPVIRPVPKSIIETSSRHDNYTYEFPFYDEKTNIINYKRIKGSFWKLSYRIFGKDTQRKDGIFSSVEIIRSYRNFAFEQGGEVLWERAEGGRLTFKIPKSGGGETWCHVLARNGYYELDIVDKEAVKEKTSSDAGQVKQKPKAKEPVLISSVLFDFDSYDLKKESIKPLREISELLLNHPRLKIEIQGHTDNRGDKGYNLRLSQKRAEVVKLYLIGLGVDALRLSAKGYGFSQPVASNKSEEGRARNRRVVLLEK